MLLFGRGVGALGGLLITLVIAKEFPIGEAGEFVTAFAVLITASFACRFGLDALSIKTLPTVIHSHQKTSEHLSDVTGLALGLSCFVSFIFLGLAYFVNIGLVGWLWTALIPVTLINLHGAFLRSTGSVGFGGFMEAGIAASITCCFLFIIPVSSTFNAWLYLSFCSWLVLLFSWVGLWKRELFVHPLTYRFRFKFLALARNFGFIQVASNLAQWGALFIIMFYMNPSASAETNALFRFMAPLQFVFLTLDFYLGPKFAQARTTDNSSELIQSNRRFGIIAALVLSLPYVLLVLFASLPLITLAIGSEYVSIQMPLIILTLAHFFVLAMGSNGILLSVSGFEKTVFVTTCVRAIVSLVLYAILIPFFGIWAICLVFALSISLEAVFYREKTKTILAPKF